jgi:response regulator NasT
MPTHNKILLVDDDRMVLYVLESGLRNAGYDTVSAESVDEAADFLAGGLQPSLAILDVRMPGKSGLELAADLRLQGIPFMMLTAYADEDMVANATRTGALGYIVKPVDIPQLVPSIEAALARAEELRQLHITSDQLQSALHAERDVSVAIGIAMMQYHLPRKEALELLRKAARSQNRKLAEVAAEIVRAGEALNCVERTKNNHI